MRRSLAALNARTYAPFPRVTISWEGRPVPKGFGPAARRLRRHPDRAADPDAIVEAFLYHLKLGYHYGYPECCILQFAAEAPLVSPLLLRGLTFGEHIPCDACVEDYLHDYITDGPVHGDYPAPSTIEP